MKSRRILVLSIQLFAVLFLVNGCGGSDTPTTTYVISGTVSGDASHGATITLSGTSSSSTTTDASGSYSFTGLSNGTYTVTPSLSGYIFSPSGTIVTIDDASVSSIDFSACGPPTLDAVFGNNGVVIYDGNQSDLDEVGNGVAIQADGKIIVAGYKDNGLDQDVLIQRYTIDGRLDSSFATSGTFIFDSGVDEAARDVVVQPDGKFIVTGYIDDLQDPENVNLLVMRLDADGALDSTFGSNGVINTDLTGSKEYGKALAIQPDGRLVVMSYDYKDIILSRYNHDGSLDDTFGDNGLSITNLAPGSLLRVLGGDMAVQGDGKIVVVSTIAGKSTVFTVIMEAFRVNSDGSNDSSFSLGTTYRIYANAVLVQDDGRIVVGGANYGNSGISEAVILRLNANGVLDTTFGIDGYLLHDVASSGEALAMAGDKIVLAGRHDSNVLTTEVVVDCASDTALSTDVASGFFASAYDIALQNNGGIVVTGYRRFSDYSDDTDLFLMRFTAE